MWKTYAAMGLADITVRKDGHVVLNSSPLKGFPTKMFRHRLASHLIAAMNKFKVLSETELSSINWSYSILNFCWRYMVINLLLRGNQKKECCCCKRNCNNADLIFSSNF